MPVFDKGRHLFTNYDSSVQAQDIYYHMSPILLIQDNFHFAFKEIKKNTIICLER